MPRAWMGYAACLAGCLGVAALMLETAGPQALAPSPRPTHGAKARLAVPPVETASAVVVTTHGARARPEPSVEDRGLREAARLRQELFLAGGFTSSWLDAHGFGEAAPALRRLHGLLDGRNAAPGGTRRPDAIAFGPQGADLAQSSLASPPPVLSIDERYVKAALPPHTGDAVLVRWRNASDGTVIELSAQASTVGGQDGAALWKFAGDGWQPGRYRVEVIAADSTLALLAAGEFEMSAEAGATTPFAFAVPGPARP